MRERTHRAGQCADSDLLPHVSQTFSVSAGFFVPDGQFEAERDRLAMNAVRAAHHHSMLVLQRLPLQDGNQLFKIVENEVERLGHLHSQSGVHNIRRGESHVKKPMLRSNRFHKRFEKGDHVVLRHLLDSGNALHVDDGLLPNTGRRATRNPSGSLECLAGGQLDREPDLILTFQFPDGFHRGTGISIDHGIPEWARSFSSLFTLAPHPLPFTSNASRLFAASVNSLPKTWSKIPFTNFDASSSPKLFANSMASLTVTFAGTSSIHSNS